MSNLETVAREMEKPQAEVMTLTIMSGLQNLRREHILDRFLRAKVSREEAIQLLGIDWVELVERQHAAMMEDLNWALRK